MRKKWFEKEFSRMLKRRLKRFLQKLTKLGKAKTVVKPDTNKIALMIQRV